MQWQCACLQVCEVTAPCNESVNVTQVCEVTAPCNGSVNVTQVCEVTAPCNGSVKTCSLASLQWDQVLLVRWSKADLWRGQNRSRSVSSARQCTSARRCMVK
jgi:hypothetical protein